jgi:uncharacterized protein DUF6897
MDELILRFMGKQIDVAYGVNNFIRGEVTDVSGGIVSLKDEEGRQVYVSADKISVVWEVKDNHSRPGFVI